MVHAVSQQPPNPAKAGRPCALSPHAQVLVTLEYWREYRTYFHIATDWGVSESTICRTVHRIEDALMPSGHFRLPGKKRLFNGFGSRPDVVVMDVTETPIERPKRKQRRFYSGKKKQHTLKCQVIMDSDTGEIICTVFGPGRRHDFTLFKASGIHFHPETDSLQDKGYQGLAQYHANSFIPKKKPKDGELSDLEKAYNRELGSQRICIERRFGLRCNLIAALYNDELRAD